MPSNFVVVSKKGGNLIFTTACGCPEFEWIVKKMDCRKNICLVPSLERAGKNQKESCALRS